MAKPTSSNQYVHGSSNPHTDKTQKTNRLGVLNKTANKQPQKLLMWSRHRSRATPKFQMCSVSYPTLIRSKHSSKAKDGCMFHGNGALPTVSRHGASADKSVKFSNPDLVARQLKQMDSAFGCLRRFMDCFKNFQSPLMLMTNTLAVHPLAKDTESQKPAKSVFVFLHYPHSKPD